MTNEVPMIDLDSAFDDFTEESLFRKVIIDNTEDLDGYDPKNALIFDNLDDLFIALFKNYQYTWSKEFDKIKYPLHFYTHIDYASMLRDDIYTGYITITKDKQNHYYVFIPLEPALKSNLINNDLNNLFPIKFLKETNFLSKLISLK